MSPHEVLLSPWCEYLAFHDWALKEIDEAEKNQGEKPGQKTEVETPRGTLVRTKKF